MENISIQDLNKANTIIKQIASEFQAEGLPSTSITWTGRTEIIDGIKYFEIDTNTITGWSSGQVDFGIVDFTETLHFI